jgi:DNA-binding response OmpR family regulator
MRPTVLICDDSLPVHESLRSFFAAENIDTLSAYDGEEALRLLRNAHVDLMILDIMLPKLFGSEVCREVRRTSDVPIIMLSALGTEDDRIRGLRLGADDYIAKPFSPAEVVERVKAVLRRAAPRARHRELRLGELAVDVDAYSVSVGGEKLKLTPGEVRLLIFFIQNAGTVLSRDRILDAVWGYTYCGDGRAVDAQIKRLRKKLPPEKAGCRIESVYGLGYRMEELP